jgi:hypothetical protein
MGAEAGRAVLDTLREWYVILSRLSAWLAGPLGEASTRLDLPLVSPFLLGLVGAVAPCQLTTNASAMAFLSRRGARSAAVAEAGAFLVGKAIIYTALGGVALAAGAELQRTAVPVAVIARRVLGPMLLLIGLGLLGVWRLRGGFGVRLAARVAACAPRPGLARAFLLGGAFAVAFCPTLFWLFFGLTVPLSLESRAGFAFPALFALGTSVPVLLVGGILASGGGGGVDPATLGRTGVVLTRVAGGIFVVAGLHDTLTYWAL